MNTKVFFSPIADQATPDAVARVCVKLAERAGLATLVRAEAPVGILQHVGEGRNVGFVKPAVTGALAKAIAKAGGKPFLTGSATLYTGRRHNACDHILQAYDHGFTPDAIHCPVIMCDGLLGADRVKVDVPGARHCPSAYLGSAVAQMDALVVVSHPTGHCIAGYGAAIKNVSMGLASRGGKLAMHHGGLPRFVRETCTACGACATWCPEHAIEMDPKAKLIEGRCVGCGQCFTVCKSGAVGFEWDQGGLPFQERLVEYCHAAHLQLKGRLLYLNVIQHYQKSCDCFDTREEALCPDVGVVASTDAIAADAASADLLMEANGRDIVLETGGCDYRAMLAYGETLGLGHTAYDLVEV